MESPRKQYSGRRSQNGVVFSADLWSLFQKKKQSFDEVWKKAEAAHERAVALSSR